MAIVHEQDVARRKIFNQPFVYTLLISFVSIVGPACPGGEFQIEMAQHRIKDGIAQTSRRAKKLWRSTGNLSDFFLGSANIGFHPPVAKEGEEPGV